MKAKLTPDPDARHTRTFGLGSVRLREGSLPTRKSLTVRFRERAERVDAETFPGILLRESRATIRGRLVLIFFAFLSFSLVFFT